jgi:hypothetical protein
MNRRICRAGIGHAYRARGSPGNPDNDPVVGHKLDALKDEWNAIMPRLAATIPTTLLGAKAVGRAALVSVTERKKSIGSPNTG